MVNNDYVKYQLTNEEKQFFILADYGIETESGNRAIGRTIVNVMNSFEIKKERSCFYPERVKNLAVRKVLEHKRYAFTTKLGMGSNYVHQMMLHELKLFLFFRQNPNITRSPE